MKPPAPIEIEAEIAALQGLKPIGPFARKTAATIAVQIDALNGAIDETAPEFEELPHADQTAAIDAMNWKSGLASAKPSAGWGDLVT
jgi:hypothetical protein